MSNVELDAIAEGLNELQEGNYAKYRWEPYVDLLFRMFLYWLRHHA